MSGKYYAYSGSLTNAANLYALAILNKAAGTQLVIHDLRIINTALSAVTGVGLRFDVIKITTATGGDAVTPVPAHGGDPNLAATTVACYSTGTGVTDGSTLFAVHTNNDEIGLTGAFPESALRASLNLLPTPVTCLDETGIAVKQITNSTAGTVAVLMIFEHIK